MNVGFFGIQFSFGLQQANMTPIYQMLGAEGKSLPLLWLAGPVTGLLVQPIIGALSDRTTHRWGRRTPYFLWGALVCSLGLLAMPYSPALWFAASLLWILDAANNVTMEPYRAYVSDRLRPEQHAPGFLTQSAFTGLAQTTAYLAPSILVWLGMSKDTLGSNGIPLIVTTAFVIGALLSFSTVYYSVKTVPELPLTLAERTHIAAQPRGVGAVFAEIWDAIREMPDTMKRLWWMALFQWYGMMCYWQYIVPTVASTVYGTNDPKSPAYLDAVLTNGQIGGFYNAIACVAAFAMVPFTRRLGAKWVHAFALGCAALAMALLPGIHDKAWLFLPMVGIGLAWASIMGNPYVLLAGSIPPARAGVYMGIFNMFIVIPMLIQMLTLPLLYDTLLGGRAENVIRLAGLLLACAAVAVCFVRSEKSA
ncbi:MAG: MFS transporter [Burkholderiales bacterium]|nr:MFS transporter [Burkholderiales bacterium]